MAKALRKTNPLLIALIDDLKATSRERKAPLWRDLANRLSRPRRNWAAVNLSRIERHATPKEVVVVPGKLLATGHLSKPVTVAAFQASPAAQAKVGEAGGTFLTLRELMAKHPQGTGIRIVG